MKTIIVTGGAGFIGGCFVRQAVTGGEYRVVNLDKLTYAGCLDSLASISNLSNHIFVEGDIGDVELVASLFKEHKPSAIVNFAAESHVDRSIESAFEFVRTNVEGTVRLLEASLDYWNQLSAEPKQGFRFLQVSTDEVYGTLDQTGLFSEATPYSPNSPYAASKASADHFVRSFYGTYGLPYLITHCSNNYGPYQFPEKLIPLMILNAVEGRVMPIYGDGMHVRDWLHVDDHCAAIFAVLQSGQVAESYNIGSNSERTNREVVDAIALMVEQLCDDLPQRPVSSLVQSVPDRLGHDKRYAIDASKIREQLGWRPTHTFEEGLKQTVSWYLDHMEWTRVARAKAGN